jgi:hypothetical protein
MPALKIISLGYVEGESLMHLDVPSFLNPALRDLESLAEDCESLGLDPNKVLSPAFSDNKVSVEWLKVIGVSFSSTYTEPEHPGQTSHYTEAYILQRETKKIMQNAVKLVLEYRAIVQTALFKRHNLDELDLYELDEKMAKINPRPTSLKITLQLDTEDAPKKIRLVRKSVLKELTKLPDVKVVNSHCLEITVASGIPNSVVRRINDAVSLLGVDKVDFT